MRNASIYILFFLSFLSPLCSFAQADLGLHFMPGLIQSQSTNPAFFSKKHINIALPGISFGGSHAGFTLSDLLQPVPGSDSLQVDFDNVLLQLQDENAFKARVQADILSVGFRVGGIQLGIHAGSRGSVFGSYPKDLIRLAWEGNGDYVGQTLSVAPDFQAFAYNEFGISAAMRLKDKIQIGARFKYLMGLADFSLSRNNLQFNTREEYYQLNLITDMQFNTSTFNLGSINSLEEIDQLEPVFTFEPTTGNTGFAADLGIVLKPHKKLSISASVKDLGFIKWTDNVSNYAVKGTVDFAGIDAQAIGDGDGEEIEELIDSVLSGLTVQSSQESYKTYLPTEFYVSATFSPIESLRLGGLIQSTFYRGQRTSAVAISASKDLGKILSLGLSYATINKSYQNLGANLLLKLGPIHFYTVADNVMAFVKPENSKFANLRFGMNVAF